MTPEHRTTIERASWSYAGPAPLEAHPGGRARRRPTVLRRHPSLHVRPWGVALPMGGFGERGAADVISAKNNREDG